MTELWADTRPVEAANWLASATVPWWFAGGWAIDLWLGRQTRPHSDLEVGCYRAELPGLLASFPGWDVQVARQKRLTPYDRSAAPPEPHFSLWLRPEDARLWHLEILVEERVRDNWCYRRDNRVVLPNADLTISVDAGYRVIAPEVQLLYKSVKPRDKDTADFEAARPALTSSARDWLRCALTTTHQGHFWLDRL